MCSCLCVCVCWDSYLRHDSLAQLLTYANVRSGADVLLAESCNGFITGCVAERMGGAWPPVPLVAGV